MARPLAAGKLKTSHYSTMLVKHVCSVSTPAEEQPPKTPTHNAPPDPESLQRTPVELKSSSIRPTSVGLQSGHLYKDEARGLYEREMRLKMVELDFDQFLDRYMPVRGHGLPSESELEIPDMNKTALLGNKEDGVCEELVRLAGSARFRSTLILLVRPVQGCERHLRCLSSWRPFNCEKHEP